MTPRRTDEHAGLPVPPPGHRWVVHDGIDGPPPLMPITALALPDNHWRPVGPINPADEPGYQGVEPTTTASKE